MKVTKTNLDGLILLEPKTYTDERGFFLETYERSRYKAVGVPEDFVQDNHSRSENGVLRGMHFQVKRPQAQLLTVMRGKIFDVCVDLRKSSETFGKWYGIELSDVGPRQIYMPPGIAHGFCVLSDFADLHYKVSRAYDHSDESGLFWNDPDVGIAWPIQTPKVTARDAAYLKLADLTIDKLPHEIPLEKI
ncbi:dTDP-4-dehydrorhamnose 3,5-epimerase [Leptospira ognonensis]|uniref:dTDP-4-dehydrorhamnose 3,5-epimerase n=1 Tax=Leptospira ognonensis TaxID=2484945 RepID=A0A4V3JRE8_9LEPT|nr:dTDP-4-dehydrorhamnose 3,5-epimerase [Leptospira ognonensis]TGL59755.1 dTDP-4-dehydrorhamnose 3,5-epimerase [Leptospira ognonensis]